jgi:hypothetical protein
MGSRRPAGLNPFCGSGQQDEDIMTRLFPPFACLLLAALLLSAPAQAATLEITGPDGATVVVNERIMGFLPLSHPLSLPPGLYEIRSELPGHQDFMTRITLFEADDVQRLQIRPSRLSKRVAWSGNLIFAGMGQHYLGKNLKGYFFNLMEAGGLLTALAGELQRGSYRQDYLLFKDRYDNAINIEEVEVYKTRSLKAYSDMEDAESLRNTGLMVAGGAVFLSVVDALINFPAVKTGPGEIPVQTSHLDGGFDLPEHHDFADFGAVHAAIRVGF